MKIRHLLKPKVVFITAIIIHIFLIINHVKVYPTIRFPTFKAPSDSVKINHLKWINEEGENVELLSHLQPLRHRYYLMLYKAAVDTSKKEQLINYVNEFLTEEARCKDIILEEETWRN